MATLCDRATVREGLLHILGAGVTQTSLILPSAPDLDLALLFHEEKHNDLSGRHTLHVALTHEDGTHIGAAELIWEAPAREEQQDAAGTPEPSMQLPIVVPLRGMVINNPGRIHVQASVDGKPVAVVPFIVTKADIPGVTVQMR
ncbi:DUF6941 family protein [Streptomyces sp. NBC_00151]|uniref:DUF6941 family protein n=1 Tax=Streptomyces sp. NBC_00151 TaxID=2975669 RepID=UPI002DD9E8E9|nr:hypothetical protein [Streptomyces sp. NBC_00151]WRZ36653.1 hypothetical protein OG915_00135 [Streptomyces sp. NBC_00151]WRZ44920.1 hypothetical protein OG915_47400 [Streptomyces sp. NBC_00151]